MKWVVAFDHGQPNRPLSQEMATNGARGMNWLQDWVHDFDALSALYWLSAAFSDSHYGSSRDDCSTRAVELQRSLSIQQVCWVPYFNFEIGNR